MSFDAGLSSIGSIKTDSRERPAPFRTFDHYQMRQFFSQPEIKLEIGGVYEARKPEAWESMNKPSVRTIVRKLPDMHLYDWEDDQGETYRHDGSFLVNMKTRFDLVKKIN
jgi:hypothetical protein